MAYAKFRIVSFPHGILALISSAIFLPKEGKAELARVNLKIEKNGNHEPFTAHVVPSTHQALSKHSPYLDLQVIDPYLNKATHNFFS
ncbi:MAG: hypothetical protein D6704_10525 [Nitrospirae bacterium]|nr:MAG: hypothetical protein D6704_10525 [Nitrospirota bacterium]